MNLKLTRVDVWAAPIDDKPGGLALTLRAIADSGANLDYVVARRDADKPGKGLVLISPVEGREQLEHARGAGFRRATELPVLRIEGGNEPGVGAAIAKAIGDSGVNMSEFSAVAYGGRFVGHAAFDTLAELDKAEAALNSLATTPSWRFWQRHAQSTVAG
jgi:hypothetical protein